MADQSTAAQVQAELLVRPGDIIDGKYEAEHVIGAGGMGVVLAARHLQLDERVAIKLMLPSMLKDPEIAERFTREARAAVKIKSEHVARVMDVGTLADGAPYIVMEYLAGGDLADELRTRGPLPVKEAVTYVLQACEAIHEAHGIGIIHRDLKPANLFLSRRPNLGPCVKVLDFGISKVLPGSVAASDNQAALTTTAALLGSPLYMSPEQLMTSRDVDTRSDIWSLGVILFELLTGTLPFEANTMPQLCIAILNSFPTAPRQLRGDLPLELERTILRCLEKEPSRRFASVVELGEALAPFASEHVPFTRSVRAQQVGMAATLPQTTEARLALARPGEASTRTSWGHTQRDAYSSRWKVAAIAVAILGVLTIAGATTWKLGTTKSVPELAPSGAASAGSTNVSPELQLAEATVSAAASSSVGPADSASAGPVAPPHTIRRPPPPKPKMDPSQPVPTPPPARSTTGAAAHTATPSPSPPGTAGFGDRK